MEEIDSLTYLDFLFDKKINVGYTLELDKAIFLIPGTNKHTIYSHCKRIKKGKQNIYELQCFTHNNIDLDGNDVMCYISQNIIIVKIMHFRIVTLVVLPASIPHDALFIIKHIKKTFSNLIDPQKIVKLFMVDNDKFNKIFNVGDLNMKKIKTQEQYDLVKDIFIQNSVTNFSFEEISTSTKSTETDTQINSLTINLETKVDLLTKESEINNLLTEVTLLEKTIDKYLYEITTQFNECYKNIKKYRIELDYCNQTNSCLET